MEGVTVLFARHFLKGSIEFKENITKEDVVKFSYRHR